ncbi:MAG: hypothetical protein ACI86M_000960, partial [Saprospiraceae bacterium]
STPKGNPNSIGIHCTKKQNRIQHTRPIELVGPQKGNPNSIGIHCTKKQNRIQHTRPIQLEFTV